MIYLIFRRKQEQMYRAGRRLLKLTFSLFSWLSTLWLIFIPKYSFKEKCRYRYIWIFLRFHLANFPRKQMYKASRRLLKMTFTLLSWFSPLWLIFIPKSNWKFFSSNAVSVANEYFQDFIFLIWSRTKCIETIKNKIEYFVSKFILLSIEWPWHVIPWL